MVFKDYYKILELKDNKVGPEAIKLAYREQVKKYHPDLNGKKTEERFKDINEAYKVLTDVNAKRKYDKIWTGNVLKKRKKEEAKQAKDENKDNHTDNKQKLDSVFTDFVHMFFGEAKDEPKIIEKRKPMIKGDNVETEINISIEEAFFGLEKKIQLKNAEGRMKAFTIKIPAGIKNGGKIRLKGLGKAGQNGGTNGNLFIKVNINTYNGFKLEGNDLVKELLLTPWEAVLGTRIDTEYIDGNAVLYVPSGIQNGEKIKIPKRGYKNDKGERGDLVMEVKITIPKSVTKEELELFKKLDETSSYNPRRKH